MSTLVRPQRDIGDGDEDGEISRVENLKGGELISYVITCDGIAPDLDACTTRHQFPSHAEALNLKQA